MKVSKLSVLGLMVLGSLQVTAEEVISKSVESIHAEAELGVILTTGNTETASYKGKLTVKQDTLKWSNKYLLDALYKEDKLDSGAGEKTTVTAEKYFASIQGDYKQ